MVRLLHHYLNNKQSSKYFRNLIKNHLVKANLTVAANSYVSVSSMECYDGTVSLSLEPGLQHL